MNDVLKHILLYDLKDALEGLQRCVTEMENESGFDESDYHVHMQHIYFHLNNAWNLRNESFDEINKEHGLDRWSCFPKDIDPTYSRE